MNKKFYVYKSSAGSGKTYTLVKEYLRLALSTTLTEKYKSILAITFTNKAASEMKERVFSALKSISNKDEKVKELVKNLSEELNIESTILVNRSAQVLESMLHNYSDISISTIDKFTHKIIRTFAQDLNLPVNFSIELDSTKILSQAVDLLIAKVGSDENLTKVLTEFVEEKANDEKNWEIDAELIEFSKNLLKEEGIQYILNNKKLSFDDFSNIKKLLLEYLQTFSKKVARFGEEGLKLISDSNIPTSNFAGGADRGIAKYFFYLKSLRYENLTPTPSLQKYIDNDNWAASKLSKEEAQSIHGIKNDLLQVFKNSSQYISQNLEKYSLYKLIAKNIYGLILLNELELVIEEIKREGNIIHISEFNKKIAKIVANEPAPFIYERLGERYQHFLIDEFQDTSVLQWQNIVPLIDNSLASGNFNMIVGDGKQSIYRWRGGEVEQFTMLPDISNPSKNRLIEERKGSFSREFEEQFLVKNFRSKMEVIDFNNQFFASISKTLSSELQKIYSNHSQVFDPINTGGLVHIEFIDKSELEPDTKLITCQRTVELIIDLKKEGFRNKDIAILVRSNKNGSLLAAYLQENNIPVISSESLLIAADYNVKLLLAFLRHINDPYSKKHNVSLIELLYQDAISDLPDLLAAIVGEKTIEKTDALLHEKSIYLDRPKLLKLPLYELCENLVRINQLDEKADVYIQFFLETVFQYTLKNDNNLSNFIDWWSEKGKEKSVVIPQGVDAVSIMTIHKAKGLQFPAVVFPFANWDQINGANSIWVDPEDENIPLPSALLPMNKTLENTAFAPLYQLEANKSKLDNLNLLYVALTRPENRLYVLTGGTRNQSVASYFLEFLKEKGLWEKDKKTYVFGEATTYQAKDGKTTNSYFPEHSFSSPWTEKIQISRQAEKLWDFENDASTTPIAYGNLLHTALSEINTLEDCDHVVQKLKQEGLVSEKDAKKLNNKLKELLNDPAIRPFFETEMEIKNEREIIAEDGSIYRPDKVLLGKEETIVLDYKTGKELSKHIKQLELYGQLLLEMGYKNIKKFLLYTEECRLELIS